MFLTLTIVSPHFSISFTILILQFIPEHYISYTYACREAQLSANCLIICQANKRIYVYVTVTQ